MKLKCMIADDEPMARRLLQEYIEDIDFLELKGSVENALKAGHLLGAEPIDLLFLDINMPLMDGWEFLIALKGEADHKHIPVIVYTTSSNKKDRLIADELGALCFVTKPHAFKRLKVMLDLVVGHVNGKTLTQLCKDLQALSNVPN